MSLKRFDLTGNRYGRFLVTKRIGRWDKKTWYECICDCGKIFICAHGRIQSGNTKSCGCLADELRQAHIKNMTLHGQTINKTRSKEHSTWHNLKQRCLNPKNKFYKYYGGRGITVCDRWLNSFSNFLEDMGKAPTANYSIERLDNDKGYEPTNCIWIPLEDQRLNKRCRKVDIGGTRMKFSTISSLLNFPISALYFWHNNGVDIKSAIAKRATRNPHIMSAMNRNLTPIQIESILSCLNIK